MLATLPSLYYSFISHAFYFALIKMAERGDRRFSYSEKPMNSSYDDAPHSRLFIICSKDLTEDDFRDAFSKFGDIEEIWVVKDRQTGDRKGVTYIKFSKTSEAAHALESMNGKTIGRNNRHLKVMIAASRDQVSKREGNDEEKIQRLFVIVPKTMTDSELYDYFKAYGEIDYASIIRDKETRESKGFAYIKYYRFSHAAKAFEQCDRKYRAVFAEPRRSKQNDSSSNQNSYDLFSKSSFSLPLPDVSSSDSYTRLQVIASPFLNQDQLWRLFDIVPGLDYCNLRYEGRPRPVRGIATVVYTSPQWAAHAREKLHGFEYPPGHRLVVKPDYDTARGYSDNVHCSSTSRLTPGKQPDIIQLAETIAQATNLIKAAGFSPDILQSRLGFGMGSSKDNEVLCNVSLPDPKPLMSIDDETAARCFVVCTPQPPPASALRDVFCRFGNLIDVYMLTNRNCGYAKYASKESAENAIKTLHGAEVCGIRIKVLEAEERDSSRKRLRLDDGPL